MERNGRTDMVGAAVQTSMTVCLSVQIAEKVEDQDDRQWNSNQPKNEATAHVKLPELLCSSSGKT